MSLQPEKSQIDSIENETKISSLSDDCLLKIFMILPVKDRIQIERVCKRWQNVCEKTWSNIKKIRFFHRDSWTVQLTSDIANVTYLNSLDSLDIKGVEKILKRCEHSLTTVELWSSSTIKEKYREMLQLLAKHCSNVTNLMIILEEYFNNELKKLFSCCHQLQRVELWNISKDFTGGSLLKLPKDKITEIHLRGGADCEDLVFPVFAMKVFTKFSNLHTLYLNNFTFTQEELKPIFQMRTLKNLAFPHCRFQTSINLLRGFNQVNSLSLDSVPQVTDKFLDNLATNCTQLKHLDISDCKNVSDLGIASIGKFPQLESLKIESLKRVTGSTLNKLVTLKSLECAFCRELTDDCVIELIENAPGLENLEVWQTGITYELIEKANKIMSSRKNGPKLTILVDSWIMDGIDEETLSPFLTVALIGTPGEFDDEYDDYYDDSDDEYYDEYNDEYYDPYDYEDNEDNYNQ